MTLQNIQFVCVVDEMEGKRLITTEHPFFLINCMCVNIYKLPESHLSKSKQLQTYGSTVLLLFLPFQCSVLKPIIVCFYF